MKKKILVIGNAGSGKSTTAKKIASDLELPCYSLDAVVWEEGWKRPSSAEVSQKIQQLINQETWVIDGVDYKAMKAADVVLFLDIPRRTCFKNVAIRNWPYLFKSRPGLPESCPEILIIPTLVKIIWRFPTKVRPKIIEEKLRRDSSSFVHIQSMVDLGRYLELATYR